MAGLLRRRLGRGGKMEKERKRARSRLIASFLFLLALMGEKKKGGAKSLLPLDEGRKKNLLLVSP